MQTDMDLESPPDGLRAAAEPLRWRILTLLAEEELCVCHLVEALDAPQSLISHHLRVLRDAGLVESERFRYWTYYRLQPAAVEAMGRRLMDLAGRVPASATTRRPCC
jgi:ArsR family transcriptional regulator, arsenate/arsenite/antimonite-responsive transcriptional repressor